MHRARIVASSALVLFALLVPRAAFAEVPDPNFDIIDPIVVGNASGTPIGGQVPGFDVFIKDVNNAPMPGRTVTLYFGNSPMRLFAAQNPGTTVNCAARTLSRVTGDGGHTKFAARVAGYENARLIEVFDEGVLVALVPARSTDIDGLDGRTGLNDFTLFSANFLGNQPAQETDFDLNGTTGLGDYILFAAEFLSSAVGTYCP